MRKDTVTNGEMVEASSDSNYHNSLLVTAEKRGLVVLGELGREVGAVLSIGP